MGGVTRECERCGQPVPFGAGHGCGMGGRVLPPDEPAAKPTRRIVPPQGGTGITKGYRATQTIIVRQNGLVPLGEVAFGDIVVEQETGTKPPKLPPDWDGNRSETPNGSAGGLPPWFVQQRADDDCVVACLAMYLRIPYERAREELPRHPGGGTCLWEAVYALRRAGRPARRTVSFFHSHPAILDLPSLNRTGQGHVCYWDGQRLYDPNTGRPGRLVWTQELLDRLASWGGTVTEVPVSNEPALPPIGGVS